MQRDANFILRKPHPVKQCRGPEIWTLKQKDIRRPVAAQMKFTRHRAGYILLVDQGINENSLEEIKVDTVEKKFAQCKLK
jgi:hypothetical protein